jgi:hypothetical protein
MDSREPCGRWVPCGAARAATHRRERRRDGCRTVFHVVVNVNVNVNVNVDETLGDRLAQAVDAESEVDPPHERRLGA